MRSLKYISFFTFNLWLCTICFAQREKIDSLRKVLPSLKDSSRIDCLNALGALYLPETWEDTLRNDSGKLYVQLAYNESKRINYIHGMAEALAWKTEIGEGIQHVFEVESSAHEAIRLFENTSNKKGLTPTYYNLGRALFAQSKFEEALKAFDSCKILSRQAGDRYYLFWSVLVAGLVYRESGNYEKAFEKAIEGQQIASEYDNEHWQEIELTIMGDLYSDIQDYNTALSYYRQAFQRAAPQYKNENVLDFAYLFSLNKQFDSAKYYFSFCDTTTPRSLRFYLSSKGDYYFLVKQYDQALSYLLRGLDLHRRVNDQNQVMGALMSIAKTYDSLLNYAAAFKYAREGLILGQQTRARQFIRDGCQILSSVYDYWEQKDSAYFYYRQYTSVKDSILTYQFRGKLAGYNYTQKIALLNKEKEIQHIQLQKQSLQKKILICSILIFLILVAIVYRNIILKRRNEKQSLEHKLNLQQLENELESQQALLNERVRISRDLHDDIGSTLGSISIYSEVAKQRTEKNENTSEVLSKIGLASRELIDKMSDIVWSLNPNSESFEQLQNRMIAFAAIILTPRNILYDFITKEKLKKLQFTGGQRKNIFLIFKEALYNIVKYADCKVAGITLSVQNNDFNMIIKDDGKGFDASPITANEVFSDNEYLGGNGIKNMNARADEMNAKLCINSKINEGTTIQLTIHL